KQTTGTDTGGEHPARLQPTGEHPAPPPQLLTRPKIGRFYGAVKLDPLRLGRDAGKIAEEVVQLLAGLVGATVDITLEIQGNLPDGASEKLGRDVTENGRTLRFTPSRRGAPARPRAAGGLGSPALPGSRLRCLSSGSSGRGLAQGLGHRPQP